MEHRRHVSLVLRLLVDEAAHGDLVGQVEVVDTGDLVAVRSSSELLHVVTELAGRPPTCDDE